MEILVILYIVVGVYILYLVVTALNLSIKALRKYIGPDEEDW